MLDLESWHHLPHFHCGAKQNSKRSKTSLSKLPQPDLLLVLTSSKLICFLSYPWKNLNRRPKASQTPLKMIPFPHEKHCLKIFAFSIFSLLSPWKTLSLETFKAPFKLDLFLKFKKVDFAVNRLLENASITTNISKGSPLGVLPILAEFQSVRALFTKLCLPKFLCEVREKPRTITVHFVYPWLNEVANTW